MKIVIQTQLRENYGAHTWDGEGRCPQHWKCKGGNTYFVDCTLEEAQDPGYWCELASLINVRDEYSDEYIISDALVDAIDFDPSNYHEHWENPIYLERTNGVNWDAQQVFEYSEYFPAHGILKQKVTSWMMFPDGIVEHHSVLIETCEGDWMNWKDANEYYSKIKEAA